MSLVDALLLDPYPFEVWIAQRSSKGTGTLNDPYGVTTAADFDTLMNSLPANSRVHLGPGTFYTKGYSDEVSGGWQIKAGVRITGAGIDVTTLQIADVQSGSTPARVFAVGHALVTGSPSQPNLVDYAEISDLTIDSNLSGQSGTQICCGAIRLMGNHVRISRIKAKKWGTKTGTKPCFAIAIVTGDRGAGLVEVINPGIEECIAVEPDSAVNVGPITALHAGPKDETTGSAEAYGKGPCIRNCYVDSGWPGSSIESRGVSMTWCRAGIIEGNQIHNTKVAGPYAYRTTTRELVIRHNTFKNTAKGAFWDLGQFESSLGSASFVRAATVMTVTLTNHNLAVGERVFVSTVPGGIVGTYRITSVAGNSFTLTVNDTGPTSGTTGVQKVYGADKLLIVGNTVELAIGTNADAGFFLQDNAPGALIPDYPFGEVIIRDNSIRYHDGAFDASYSGSGIAVSGVKNLLVRNNVIESAAVSPLGNARSGAATYFNNRTPSGVLIQGVNGTTSQKYGELETDAEDALALATLQN